MKIATAAYPMDWFPDRASYEAKLTAWVAEAAGQGADLLVFPEYGAMEIASLAEGTEGDLMAASRAIDALWPQVHDLHLALAARYGVHILGASGPAREAGAWVNRCHLYTPGGGIGVQDKQLMTLWEVDPWGIEGADGAAGPLRVFDTALGRIAINICYDSEFPLLARAQVEAGAEILLVPSCTETSQGYWRVRIGAQARALEGQCIAVMSSTVGTLPQVDAVDVNSGAGGVFGPPDRGFPADGVISVGLLDQPGWTYAEVDLSQVRAVREGGNVRNARDWTLQGNVRTEVSDLR